MRKWLRDLREASKMSQQTVAERIGISQNYYCMIESGERQSRMTIEMAKKLAEVFGVPIDTILENENQA